MSIPQTPDAAGIDMACHPDAALTVTLRAY